MNRQSVGFDVSRFMWLAKVLLVALLVFAVFSVFGGSDISLPVSSIEIGIATLSPNGERGGTALHASAGASGATLCTTVDIYATPNPVPYPSGDTSLSWTLGGFCANCNFNGEGWQAVGGPNPVRTVSSYPAPTPFTVQCSMWNNEHGHYEYTNIDSVDVYVASPPAPTCTLTAADEWSTTINSGESTWMTMYIFGEATSAAITPVTGNIPPGSFPASGGGTPSYNTGALYENTTYTGTVTGPGGGPLACVAPLAITVTPPPTCTLEVSPGWPSEVVYGGSTRLRLTPSAGATGASISPNIGTFAVTGGFSTDKNTGNLTAPTQFTGTVTGPSGIGACTGAPLITLEPWLDLTPGTPSCVECTFVIQEKPFTLTSDITSVGSLAAGVFDNSFDIRPAGGDSLGPWDGSPQLNFTTAGQSGESAVADLTLVGAPGGYEMRVAADSGGNVTEQNEDNNETAWLPFTLSKKPTIDGFTVVEGGSGEELDPDLTDGERINVGIDPTINIRAVSSGIVESVWFERTFEGRDGLGAPVSVTDTDNDEMYTMIAGAGSVPSWTPTDSELGQYTLIAVPWELDGVAGFTPVGSPFPRTFWVVRHFFPTEVEIRTPKEGNKLYDTVTIRVKAFDKDSGSTENGAGIENVKIELIDSGGTAVASNLDVSNAGLLYIWDFDTTTVPDDDYVLRATATPEPVYGDVDGVQEINIKVDNASGAPPPSEPVLVCLDDNGVPLVSGQTCYVNEGDSVNLRWFCPRPDSHAIGENFEYESGVFEDETQDPEGIIPVTPLETRTYRILCLTSQKPAEEKVVVIPASGGPGGDFTIGITADPGLVPRGDTTDLEWEATGVEPGSCSVTSLPSVPQLPVSLEEGSILDITINSQTTFTIECFVGDDTVKASAAVFVLPRRDQI
jgi:hypothetical protein